MPSDNSVMSETTFHVRYAETDAMGVVHHGSYIVYFEEGRSNYIRQRGDSYAAFERTGYYLVVSEVGARYLKPARYDDKITVRCWIEDLKSRQLTFGYEIVAVKTEDVLVTGFSKHIVVSHDGRVGRIPDQWRAWLNTASS